MVFFYFFFLSETINTGLTKKLFAELKRKTNFEL